MPLANQQLQAIVAAQRARENNRGAGADVHPDVAASGVRPSGTGKSSPSVNAVPSCMLKVSLPGISLNLCKEKFEFD